MNKVVAYARCSLLLRGDPELQLVAIREFARNRGFDLTGEYVDRITGDRERRPGLDKLIADARAGRVKVIVVTAVDRIFRSTRHMLNLLEELRHYGVSLISLRENLDFTTPTGQMTLTVLSAVATLEKQIISERIRTSLAAKKLAAAQTGTVLKLGRPSVVTDDLSDEVLRLRARGESIRAIGRILKPRASRATVARICKGAGPNAGRLKNVEIFSSQTPVLMRSRLPFSSDSQSVDLKPEGDSL